MHYSNVIKGQGDNKTKEERFLFPENEKKEFLLGEYRT